MVNSTNYWIEEAKEDLITANALLKTKRYLECGFFCHLAMEKILKALIFKRTKKFPPKSHNLILLAKKSGILAELDEQIKELIVDLQIFNIEGRYPEDRRKMLSIIPKSKFNDVLTRTKETVIWLEKNYI